MKNEQVKIIDRIRKQKLYSSITEASQLKAITGGYDPWVDDPGG